MEWMVVNPHIHNMFACLGSHIGESYVVNPECHMTLDEILKRLSIEDRTLRTFRRAIGFSQNVKKDVLPLLIYVKEDRKVIDTAIKILVNLTMPVECLLPIEVMSKTEAGRNTIYELNWLLTSCKEAFLDPKATRRIVDHIKEVLEKDKALTPEDCESLNNCVVLLRNILHIPEMRPSNTNPSHQNQILWNLFAQNIDKVLIELMTGEHKSEWGLAMVQLIALLYKDQHVATLQKLLNLWFESSLSESSEDNESNTSPPERGSGDSSSSSMLTSDPTSDSSDNSGSDRKMDSKFKTNMNQKSSHEKHQKKQQNPSRKPSKAPSKKEEIKPSAQTASRSEKETKMECASSEVSDCGYATQVENQESISTSSNEDDAPRGKPVHQKPANLLQKSRYPKDKPPPLTPQDKAEMKRKKLVKRSRTHSMNVKALLHHTPSDEDISHLLKEFTVDFLLKGYGSLVAELRQQLLFNSQAHAYMDTSHFFWLITYFLKFATQLELDLESLSSILSFDVVSYLTFEGVNLCEQFELSKNQQGFDLTPCLRRLHLVVTAIREVVQAVDTYKKAGHLSKEDQQKIGALQMQICETEDLRCLFVLLLRQFTPTVQSKQYLQDVIVTNHMLLSFIENSAPTSFASILHNHMRQFVTVDVMKQYGLLLECFQENGQFVNDCVFTMMHHVAGDLEHVAALFQPNILKTFSEIWESDFQICDDWSDLIEYVINKFINMPRTVPLVQEKNDMDTTPLIQNITPPRNQEWSQEECDSLYWYYVQSVNSQDPVGTILSLYEESGTANKTRIGVIEQLLKQDVITRTQYNELMEKEPITTEQPSEQLQVKKENLDEIEVLKAHLVKEDKAVSLVWIQKVLLEACHAKLSLTMKTDHIIEPVAYYFTLLQDSIPVVPWNCEQSSMMQFQPFVLLLHKLGFLLPVDAGKVYARIPQYWTPDVLYKTAQKLGPLQPGNESSGPSGAHKVVFEGWVKFDPLLVESEQMKTDEEMQQEVHSFATATNFSPAYITYTPEPNTGSNWLQMTQLSKITNPAPQTTETAPQVELAVMSVSDDEQRPAAMES